jgi:cobalamin synthase
MGPRPNKTLHRSAPNVAPGELILGGDTMKARRTLAIAALILPMLVAVWALTRLDAGTTIMKFEAPQYPEISTEQMVAALSKEQIAQLARSSIEKHRQMEGLWRTGRIADYMTFSVLAGLMSLLGLALAILLWRRPAGRTDE